MKTKVLVISTVGLIYDGITSVITSYLSSIDKSNLEIYVGSTIRIEPDIEKKLSDIGCKIVELPSRREATFRYFGQLFFFMRKNKIDVLHAHGNSGTLAIEMAAGWLGGCKKRIAHSHNTKCEQVKADRLLRPFMYAFCNCRMACGEAAGKWLFKDRSFEVLQNGRSVELFSFSNELRMKQRTKYNLSGDDIAIGHIGGFFEQKNHAFLIEIYKCLVALEPNVKLFCVGDGPLRTSIEQKAAVLSNNILFTGNINDANEFVNAMDGMLLPSLFEGLPLVAIEWQMNGLPSVLSDAVTKECVFSDEVAFMSLETSAEEWASKILSMIKRDNRSHASQIAIGEAIKSGFDIESASRKLLDIYLMD